MDISFSQYMNQWLYGTNGYYSSAKRDDEKIGKSGDFYTAVSVSRFFGGCIARHILDLLESNVLELPLSVVEFGAHNGKLLSDIIEFLDALSVGVVDKTRFFSIEPLPFLREMQAQNPRITPLKDLSELEANLAKSSMLDSKANNPQGSVFMLSNELFDAFACDVIKDNHFCFIKQNHLDSKPKIVWKDSTQIQHEIQTLESIIIKQDFSNFATKDSSQNISLQIAHLKRILTTKEKLQIANGEIPLGLEEFIECVCECCAKSAKSWRFLNFDYGTQIHRNAISLRGYKSHRVLDFSEICENLDKLFGSCDLTYEVDFSRIITLFSAQGANLYTKSSLNAALVEFGISRMLEDFFNFCQNAQKSQKDCKDFGKIYQQEVLRVRELLSPNGMGERFFCVEFGN